ncbi:MAG: wax ester/triacylglycerol synthase family O-acyltransferase, partial [Gammaproteobacteria bacterium]
VFHHFEERLHLVPGYRRRVAHVPFNLGHPTWEDDPDFDLANHVKHHQLPQNATLEDGIDAAMELNEPLLDRRHPLWCVYVINGVPDQTLLLQMTHHSMIDGVSGVELSTIIYDFDPRGGNREPATEVWEPEPPLSPMARLNEAVRDNLEAARNARLPGYLGADPKQRQLLARAARVLGRFVTRPVITAPFNAGLVGPKRHLRYMKQSFAEFREIRRMLGGTINDVVLTVVSEAVARYLRDHDEAVESRYLRIMCPVSVRTKDEAGTLGNRVSAIFPVLPAWPMDLVQRLTAVCAETERIKHDEEAQALALLTEAGASAWPIAMAPSQLIGTPWDPTALAARIPAPLMPAVGWRPPNIGYNFVCTNVPGVQVPQYLAGHEVTDTIGELVLAANVGFSVTILSYNHQIFFSCICEPRLMPDLEVMIEAMHASFDELLDIARKRALELGAVSSPKTLREVQ